MRVLVYGLVRYVCVCVQVTLWDMGLEADDDALSIAVGAGPAAPVRRSLNYFSGSLSVHRRNVAAVQRCHWFCFDVLLCAHACRCPSIRQADRKLPAQLLFVHHAPTYVSRGVCSVLK